MVAPTGLSAENPNTGADGVEAPQENTTDRPNILLVLADDLGFSDLASYGSEIRTPTLDALAQQGLRFTNYHTAANCAPARAMLLTGVDAHMAGVSNIPEMLAPEQRQYSHYQGVLGDNVVTVATLLEGAGFRGQAARRHQKDDCHYNFRRNLRCQGSVV